MFSILIIFENSSKILCTMSTFTVTFISQQSKGSEMARDALGRDRGATFALLVATYSLLSAYCLALSSIVPLSIVSRLSL